MLGREIEVPLYVTTESSPDAPSLTTEYTVALQLRLASAHEVVRRHLGKAVNARSEITTSACPANHFRLDTLFARQRSAKEKGGILS